MRLCLPKILSFVAATAPFVLCSAHARGASRVDWECIKANTAKYLVQARSSPGWVVIEQTSQGTTFDGIPVRVLIDAPEKGVVKGEDNLGTYFYTDSEGVHHTVKVLKWDQPKDEEREVHGALIHQSLGGPEIFRIGLASTTNGNLRIFIDRREFYHGEEVFTLKGITSYRRPAGDVDLGTLYKGSETNRLTRQIAHLVVDASENNVLLKDPDVIFTQSAVELIDPGYWKQSPEALEDNILMVSRRLILDTREDPRVAAAFISDLEEELRLVYKGRVMPAGIESNLERVKVEFLSRLLIQKLRVLVKVKPTGRALWISFTEDHLFGTAGNFAAKEGDRISAIDGKPITSLTPQEMLRLFDGTLHMLAISRGAQNYLVSVDLRLL